MATRNKKGGGDVVLGGRHLMGFFALLVVMLGVAFTLGYLLGRNQYDPQLRAAASTVPATSDPPANSAKSAASPGLVSASTSKKNSAAHPPAPPPPDWDFYHSGEPAKPAERLAPQPNGPPNAPPNGPDQPNRAPTATVPVADHPSPPVSAKPSAHSTSSSSKLSAGGNARSSRESSGGTRPKGSAPNSKTSSPTSSTTPSAGSKFIPHGSTVLQVAAVVRQADALSLAQALQKKKFPAFVVPPDTDKYYRVQVGPYGSTQSANAAQQQLEKQGFKSIIKR